MLKTPELPQAYELRILDDDDDGYSPDPNIAPLEKTKKIGEINFSDLVLLENPNYEYMAVMEQDEFGPEFLKLCERNVIFFLN